MIIGEKKELLTPREYNLILHADFMGFIERAFYELNPEARFAPSPHIELIASKLEACRQGKIKRLIINLPPRSLKSHCASIAFPAWLLGHNPAEQIICVSYGQELSDKLARDCRTLVGSAFFKRVFPGLALSAAKQSVGEFVTTAQGSRLSTSVGGTLTGRGGNYLIIDDPLKPGDALSETQRTACNEWFANTLLSRLNSKVDGCIIVIMQRLHQDDLVGYLTEQGGWEVLSFPAIAEEDETFVIENPFGRYLFRRKAGEVLHPAREPLEMLTKLRASVGEYNFSSQYQQAPVPIGGAMVKTGWLQYYSSSEGLQKFDRIIQSWDTANKANELCDFSVCTTWGVKNGHYYLLDVFRARVEYPELRRKVKELSTRFNPTAILIEDKASGTQLIQDLGKADGVGFISPFQPPAGMDKVMRLHAQTTAFEAGRVLLPSQAPWLADYVKELTGFPGSKYDDQVDSTTQALAYLESAQVTLDLWSRLAR